MADVAMPRLSDSMEEGTILKWLKSDGDEVSKGEELAYPHEPQIVQAALATFRDV